MRFIASVLALAGVVILTTGCSSEKPKEPTEAEVKAVEAAMKKAQKAEGGK
jgi:predicted component of type VI protein secretion system